MIKLSEDIYIDADEWQYIVKIKRKRKEKQIFDVYGYYSTLSNALEGVAMRSFRLDVHNTDMTIEASISAILRIQEDVKSMLHCLDEFNLSKAVAEND